MKKYMYLILQPFLLVAILLIMLLLNSFATSLSLELLYVMIGVAVLLTIYQYVSKSGKPSAFIQILYMIFFAYLAFSLLVVGNLVNDGPAELILYIALLMLDWFGLGYTAIQFKNLMKI